MNSAYLTLECSASALEKAEISKRNQQVFHNITKFQLSKQQMRCKLIQETVLDSETYQQQLDRLQQEIDVEADARLSDLKLRLRHLNECIAGVRTDLICRQKRLEHAKSR
ncbi:unnamed protein product [Protopolystoma xenopodis]|uniref:Uncharacterized protein n=1 Tax=Protopolystoma xenopodis TaxID=117903 RepID=A0A3S5AMD5_9PLAT|nr:unnamed protein product [Protopolystoma xenopodis]